MDLERLKSLMKKDPRSYKDDFEQQYRHYKSQLEIFKLKPKENGAQFGRIVRFIAAVSFSPSFESLSQSFLTLLIIFERFLRPTGVWYQLSLGK